MKYLLDTDALFISVLSLFELEYSFASAIDTVKKTQIRNTIDDIKYNSVFTILPIHPESARLYGEIKSFLKTKKKLNRNTLKKTQHRPHA